MKKIIAFLKKLLPEKGVKIDLQFPTCWESMSHADFKDVCIILCTPRSREETLFLCLCRLAGLTPDNPGKYDSRKMAGRLAFRHDGKSYIISSSSIQAACRQLSFILDGIGLPPSPFPQINRKLYGISFEKYYYADSLMLRAAAENNEGYYKEVVKSLSNGQKRKLLPWERKALVIWWNGLKHHMMQTYPHVLESGESISDRTQAELLQDLLSCMNDNRPQENEKILKTDVHSVLYSLNNIYRNAKQKQSSQNNK